MNCIELTSLLGAPVQQSVFTRKNLPHDSADFAVVSTQLRACSDVDVHHVVIPAPVSAEPDATRHSLESNNPSSFNMIMWDSAVSIFVVAYWPNVLLIALGVSTARSDMWQLRNIPCNSWLRRCRSTNDDLCFFQKHSPNVGRNNRRCRVLPAQRRGTLREERCPRKTTCKYHTVTSA